MKLTTFLSPENIHCGVELSSKKRALEFIGKQVAENLNRQFQCDKAQEFCPIDCFATLFKREKLGSTAINNGVALPHAKLPKNEYIQLDEPIAIFLQLDTPIDYEAQDHKDVDLIYAILFPEQNCEQYKGCLQNIAQQLSDKNVLKHLRAATSSEEVWQVLTYADQHTD
ncbi:MULTISPECIES: PTS sugar transporter subunit IIA [Glaesserella]|nr:MULTISPECIES: PTS sugar transporter subunit IIA [Glaesserella]